MYWGEWEKLREEIGTGSVLENVDINDYEGDGREKYISVESRLVDNHPGWFVCLVYGKYLRFLGQSIIHIEELQNLNQHELFIRNVNWAEKKSLHEVIREVHPRN